jgi:WD40 repeat protein
MAGRAILIIGGAALVMAVAFAAAGWMLLRVVDEALSGGDPHGSLWIYDLNTGELTRIADRPAQSVAWTSDSQSIWFSAAGYPGNGGHSVDSIDLPSREISKLFGIGSGGYVTLAPAAGLAAYAQESGTRLSVRIRAIDGYSATIEDANYPSFDESGATLSFSRPSCGLASVFETNPRDPTLIEPAPSPPTDIGPSGDYSLSPNGRYVTYSQARFGEVFLRDLEQGTEISLGDGFEAEAWAPDSTQFVFRSRPDGFARPDTQVLRIVSSTDGSIAREIDIGRVETRIDLLTGEGVDEQELVSSIAWSPDGRMLAIGVVGGGGYNIPCE